MTVPFWCCISNRGPNLIKRIEGSLDTKKYVGCLKELVVSPAITFNRPLVHSFYPTQRATTVGTFLEEQNSLYVLPWARQSDDLTPFPEMFTEMVQLLTVIGNRRVATEDDIWAAVPI